MSWFSKKEDKPKTLCDYCGKDSNEGRTIWVFYSDLRICVKCMKKCFDKVLKNNL